VGDGAKTDPGGAAAHPVKARHPVTMMILAATRESRVTQEV
jgi:hypothetical protein